MKDYNIMKLTDGYKPSHWLQYPADATGVFSFFESRGGRFPEVLFVGLQYIIKRFLTGQVVTREKIAAAKARYSRYFMNDRIFNEAGWTRILEEYDGHLPVIIRAVPEGMRVPVSHPLLTVENTDMRFPWLTNYLEPLISQVWYPTTVATVSAAIRAKICHFLEETGDPSLVNFKLHDFGFRGSTTPDSAGIGGFGHLVNFMGTDTMSALDVAEDYYSDDDAAKSIPAAEHSTITAYGAEGELEAYQKILNEFPTGPIAVVSDSYDVFRACRDYWGKELRKQVLDREGVLVIRPDSGNPRIVVPKVLEILGDAFGYVVNKKGFKVLDPHVRVIQGDGIDEAMVGEVLAEIKQQKWSADNLTFGCGGGLLQKVDRGTNDFTFKCSAVRRSGVWKDAYKKPVTDSKKLSKPGRLILVRQNGRLKTSREGELNLPNLLEPVFRNGKLLKNWSLKDIRTRAWG